MKKFYSLLKLFAILLISIKCSFASTGIFDTIINSYASTTSNWSNTLLPVARYVFWFIAALEFCYQISIKKLLPNELQKLWVFLIVRMFITTVLAIFVLDLQFYTSIVSWFAELGAAVGGTNMTSSSSSVIDFSPSEFFNAMWDQFFPTISAIMVAAGSVGLVSSATGNFLFGLSGIIIICIFIMVFVVMLTLIEAYFVLFAGIILAGFAGSSWTINYWQKYMSYVGGVAIRLFCTSILLGMITAQWTNPTWLIQVPEGSSWITNSTVVIKNLLSMLGAFGFDMVLMVTIPSKAASMLNGTVNASLGEAIGAASMAMSGGRMISSTAAGVGGGASSVTKGIVGAGASAKSAAFKAMRDGMNDGMSSEGGGSDEMWKQSVKTSGQNAANKGLSDSIKKGFSEGKDAFKGGVNAAKNHAGAFAGKANSASGPSSGGSSINIDPHRH